MLKGVLIKESLRDENVIDLLDIDKVELWRTDDDPKYWTAIYFNSQNLSLPKILSKAIMKNWYCDMKYDNETKIIVFYKKIMQYTIGNEREKNAVIKKCQKMGVPQDLLNWDE